MGHLSRGTPHPRYVKAPAAPVENIIEPQVPHAPSFNTSMKDILGGIFGAAPQFAQSQFDEFSQFAPQTVHRIRNIAERDLVIYLLGEILDQKNLGTFSSFSVLEKFLVGLDLVEDLQTEKLLLALYLDGTYSKADNEMLKD